MRLARYGKILNALSHPSRKSEGGHVLLFEQFMMTLSHDDYVLALYCLLSLRPRHKGLAKTAWRYLRKTKEPVKKYIYDYLEFVYFDLLYDLSFEERTKAISIATRRAKNPNFIGEILAVNMKTLEEIRVQGVEELATIGFNPGQVYNCINEGTGALTHRGHIFIRIRE